MYLKKNTFEKKENFVRQTNLFVQDNLVRRYLVHHNLVRTNFVWHNFVRHNNVRPKVSYRKPVSSPNVFSQRDFGKFTQGTLTVLHQISKKEKNVKEFFSSHTHLHISRGTFKHPFFLRWEWSKFIFSQFSFLSFSNFKEIEIVLIYPLLQSSEIKIMLEVLTLFVGHQTSKRLFFFQHIWI